MDQTCDRCGPAIGAAYRVDRAGELYLCGHRASLALAGAVRSGLDLLAAGEPAGAHQPVPVCIRSGLRAPLFR